MNLGTLLRKHRKQQKLTLKTVAEQVGVSEGFLSQVENAVNAPSVDTLLRICKALGVDAGELLIQIDKQPRIIVMRRSEWQEVEVPERGFATRRFFSPENRSVIDSALLVLEPDKSIPVRKNIKNGQEILCVLQGSAELTFGNENVRLEEGDVTHFWSNTDNQVITNHSDRSCYMLWVGTL
jgi:transcriptional regulator with XRE-family HTH domain